MVPKAKTGARMAFELKQRLLLSLNKLSDRDTHQIAVHELEKITQSLTPDGIPPFLSCITDTDSEHKTAVRKESVRLMATLARCHPSLLLPQHIGKMLTCIVKRLKDSDSLVRDACVDTVGVLTSAVKSDAAFLSIVKPLFEALGEQSRYVQTGSALCLARAMDEAAHPPPPPLLQQMLARVVKLLRNPHFMAKPAIIQLIRSIIQV